MSTKGNSGGDGFFDDFEDDFFKDGEDDSFWNDDKVDAYDSSAAIPKSELEGLKEKLAAEDAPDEADGGPGEPEAREAAPAAAATTARSESFVPPTERPERSARSAPPVPESPFMMPLPTPPAPPPVVENAPDTFADRALFSSPTLILPRDDDDAEASTDGPLEMGDGEDVGPGDDDAMMVGETVGAGAVAPSQEALDARLDGGVMDVGPEGAGEGGTEDPGATVADEDLPTEMAERPVAPPRQLDAEPESDGYTEEELELARDERAARLAGEGLAEAAAAATVAPALTAPAPVSEPAPQLPAYAPHDGDGGTWAEAALALEREAGLAGDAGLRGRLLAAAGRIHFARCGSWEDAARCFRAALAAGNASQDVLVSLGHVVASEQSFEELRDILVQRAAVSEGREAAGALHDAALVTRNHLRDETAAAALLSEALDHAPEDWFSLRLLREQLHRTEDWSGLVHHLGRMAEVVGGASASRLLVEQGQVLEQRLGRTAEAASAYAQARAADPGSVEAFLALERHALAAGDPAALAALYRAEAESMSGADAAHFAARAARAAEQAGDTEAAARDWSAALDAAGPGAIELLHAQQAFLVRTGATDALRSSLEAEAACTTGIARAAALYRLAGLLEGPLGDAEAALGVYREVVEADPGAAPAAEAVARLLRSTGRHAELLDFMAGQIDAITDPNILVTTLYRMGELCEGPMDDSAGARGWYEQILGTAPGYLPALEGLERVYTRLEEWAPLASVYERRAELAGDAASSALQLHRAGSVVENRMGDAAAGLAFYKRALEQAPDFPPSLDAHNRLASAAADWTSVSGALLAAATATGDVNTEVSLTYRAARVMADHAGEPAAAMDALRRCLQLSPGFLPAILLLRDLATSAGAWRDVYDLQRLEADATLDPDRRAWRMMVAADAATRLDDVDALGVIRGVLDETPSHAGAQAALELEAHRISDVGTLLLLLRQRAAAAVDDSERVRIAARMADAAAEIGDDTVAVQAVSEVAASAAEGRPLVALARLAERLGFWEEAEKALVAAGAVEERARLVEQWSKDPEAAVTAWKEAFAADGSGLAAASGMERALSRAGAREGLAAAHAGIAAAAEAPAVASVHALLAGHLEEAAGNNEAARAHYESAFASTPGVGKAFDALRRLAVQQGDAASIEALYARLERADAVGLLDALEAADATDAAARVLRERLESDPGDLEALVHLEQVLSAAGEWKSAFETLGQRLELTGAEEERAAISAKRRWILAEHLADTDEAWDFYRQLHEESPEDASVLEALARIAGARGETQLAVEYLEGLAAQASGPDAARYQRRIAEAHGRTGDGDAVRDALMRALDHHPEDLEALAGLRELHAGAEDWRALVGVLAREATVVDGEAQVARYRDIATVWEERLGESSVAMDAWRKVLEVAPDDAVALEHLVALGRSTADWAAFTEYGEAWLRHVPEGDRVALQAELGSVYAHQLRREDEALRFLGAATSGEHPDLEAAKLYERIYEGRGNWSEAVEGILRQARATEGEEAVSHYLRAAQRRIETLHDRDGAAAIYRQVLDVDATNGEALRFLGDHLYDAGDLAGAVDVYARMVEGESQRDLDDFDVQIEVALFFFRFAESLRQLERPVEALERYEQGLKLNPSHLPSLEAVGPLYMDGERWDDAAKVYRQILQLTGGQGDPERLARTYTNLGKVEFHLGNLDKAKKRFNKALELRANDIRALQGIASVLFARSDWNNLLNVYNNIIYHAQEPGEVVDAYLTKGFVLDAKMGLPDKAQQHYEKSLAFDPSQPAALLRLAELALRKQDWPEASSTADRGLALEPGDKRVRTGLQLVKVVAYASCGDDTAAEAARTRAHAVDATLSDALPPDATATQVHDVLRARLQSQL